MTVALVNACNWDYKDEEVKYQLMLMWVGKNFNFMMFAIT